MKQRLPLIGALVLALLVCGGLAVWLARDEAPGPLTLYGNVDIRELRLAFRQGGRVLTMALQEGDAAAPDTVLATLDAQPFREALAAAEAELAVARAELARLVAGNRPQEIAQAQAALREARARNTAAQREYERQQYLVKTDASSQRELDRARAEAESAAAAVSAAQEALALREAGFRNEEIDAGRARVAAAEAHFAQAQTALADTALRAPSAATVLSRLREPGSLVAAGEPVYTLSLRDPVYVRAYVSEPQLGAVAPGTRVQVHTDGSDRAYEGQVGFVSPRAEFTPKSVETAELRTDLVYRLRIVVRDADAQLRQGMPVTVTVPSP